MNKEMRGFGMYEDGSGLHGGGGGVSGNSSGYNIDGLNVSASMGNMLMRNDAFITNVNTYNGVHFNLFGYSGAGNYKYYEATNGVRTSDVESMRIRSFREYMFNFGYALTGVSYKNQPIDNFVYSNIEYGYASNLIVAAGQGDGLKTTLGYFNDGFNASGIAATGVELYTGANAPSRIAYTTINGTRATVSSAKVVGVAKAAGTYALGAGIAVDITLSITGNQSWGKTIINTGVGLLPLAIGTGPGLVVGLGYLILDKLGAFDRPTNLPSYTPPSYAVPDATRVAMPIIYP